MDLNKFYGELDEIFKTQDINVAEKYALDYMEQAQKESNIAGILASANELGGIYRVTSRFEEGKNAYNVALQAIKVLGLENTEQHGTTALNLATVYAASKNNEEALKLYEQAATIFERAGLNRDYRMAALYNNISHVYEDMKEYRNAEVNAEKALNIIQTLPDSDIELATTYTTIANIYVKQQKYIEAERNLYTAEKIFQSQSGKVNVHYGATLNAMGELYYHMQNYAKSVEYFKKSLELVKDNYGEENMSYASICKNLAFVYGAMGENIEKINYEKIAETISERINKI